MVAGLLAVAWLGVNASWGLTDPGDTLISGQLREIASVEVWLLVCVAVLGAATAITWRRHRGPALVAGMLLGFLGGTWLAGLVDSQVVVPGSLPVRRFIERSFQVLPAVPMLVAWWYLPRSAHNLRWGSWSRVSSLWRTPTWTKALLGWLAFVALPMTLVMQAQVEFRPFLNGGAWAALAPLTALALLNAFIEELLFRGLVQAALVAAVGSTAGVWLQAAFFGIHHWGAGPVGAAGIPIAIVTGCLGVLWGRSVLETRGLGWAIVTHASLDLAFFLAQFVPNT